MTNQLTASPPTPSSPPLQAGSSSAGDAKRRWVHGGGIGERADGAAADDADDRRGMLQGGKRACTQPERFTLVPYSTPPKRPKPSSKGAAGSHGAPEAAMSLVAKLTLVLTPTLALTFTQARRRRPRRWWPSSAPSIRRWRGWRAMMP